MFLSVLNCEGTSSVSIGNEHSPLGQSWLLASISSASQPTEKKGKSQASPLSVMCLLHLHLVIYMGMEHPAVRLRENMLGGCHLQSVSMMLTDVRNSY